MINGNSPSAPSSSPPPTRWPWRRRRTTRTPTSWPSKKGNEDDPRVKKLVRPNSPEVKKFIEDKYKDGSVIPAFGTPKS
ncbi:Lipoprotein OS=Streptomyces rimosus subsp. rimosus (strain ATCC / DSM 40260 / JCM 4667 / NRRL 2234) OX=1265868 GN=SRIM_007085 PE=3 SV=1 [Streptomyces rimosus subsp. rimosus]